MSDAAKPVEEVIAPVAATEETPAVESTPAPAAETVEATTEVPAAEPVAEEAAVPVVEEVKPIEEGVLGYKGPGLLK